MMAARAAHWARHWPLAAAMGIGMAWLATVGMGPTLVRLQGERTAALGATFVAAQSIGFLAGGLLWTRWPGRARPMSAGALGAAAVLLALLPWAPAGAPGVLLGAAGWLTGFWVPAWAAAVVWQVAPGERARVYALGDAVAHVVLQVQFWLDGRVSPRLVIVVLAVALAAATAVPLRSQPASAAPAQPPDQARALWRLLPLLVVMWLLAGLIRIPSAPALVDLGGKACHWEYLVHAAAALLAGTLIDRGRRLGVGLASIIALGAALTLPSVAGGAAAEVLMRPGVRVGMAFLDVFWFATLVSASGALGPATTVGYGYAAAAISFATGVWLQQALSGPLATGVSLLALFAATGLVWGLPEARAAPRTGQPVPDLVGALRASARSPLTRREMDVALLLLKGYSTGKMAATLYLTEYTVRMHLHNIFRKTGTGNRSELLALVLAHVSDQPGA